MAIGICQRFQQLLYKVAVTVHKGYFPNVGAYSPINRVFFVICGVNLNSEK